MRLSWSEYFNLVLEVSEICFNEFENLTIYCWSSFTWILIYFILFMYTSIFFIIYMFLLITIVCIWLSIILFMNFRWILSLFFCSHFLIIWLHIIRVLDQFDRLKIHILKKISFYVFLKVISWYFISFTVLFISFEIISFTFHSYSYRLWINHFFYSFTILFKYFHYYCDD